MTDTEPTFLSIPEAAVALGLSVRAVERRLHTGQLNRYKRGRQTVVSAAELAALLNPPVVPAAPATRGGGWDKSRTSRRPAAADLWATYDQGGGKRGGTAHVARTYGVAGSTAATWLRTVPRPKAARP